MDRRSFFKSMVGGVAAAAAVRTFPFRVFSFPSEIKVAPVIQRVRFIRAFNVQQNTMINRWDVLYGFGQLDNNPGTNGHFCLVGDEPKVRAELERLKLPAPSIVMKPGEHVLFFDDAPPVERDCGNLWSS